MKFEVDGITYDPDHQATLHQRSQRLIMLKDDTCRGKSEKHDQCLSSSDTYYWRADPRIDQMVPENAYEQRLAGLI